MIIPRIPALKSLAPQFNFKIRYQAAAAALAKSIFVGDLLDSLSFSNGTNLYRTLVAVRLKSIQAWGPMDSTLTPVSLGVIWLSNSTLFGGPSKVISDTSMGASEVAYVNTSPPKGSLAAQWFQSNSTQTSPIVTLDFPVGTIFDVLFEGAFSFQGIAELDHGAGSGTNGVQYIRALDISTGSVIVPLIVATI
jgi:hypothetical protein